MEYGAWSMEHLWSMEYGIWGGVSVYPARKNPPFYMTDWISPGSSNLGPGTEQADPMCMSDRGRWMPEGVTSSPGAAPGASMRLHEPENCPGPRDTEPRKLTDRGAPGR